MRESFEQNPQRHLLSVRIFSVSDFEYVFIEQNCIAHLRTVAGMAIDEIAFEIK